MYSREDALVNDFISCIPKSPFAKDGLLGVSKEFNYNRGRADIILMTFDNEVVAFEAKLQKWREALHQAYRNTCFAHSSYIIVPKDVAERAAQYEIEFAQRLVGICYVNNNKIVIARKAIKSIPIQEWLLRRAQNTLIGGQNNFRLLAEKGEGTFKKTYSVNKGEEIYALKVYKPELLSQRGAREIDAMKRCNHPNIAKLFSLGTIELGSSKILFTLEEYLDGGTLQELLEKNGLISITTLIELGVPLINAVEHIQSLDLVHRDLKPENIIFRKQTLSPVITDFGIVRDLRQESLTQSWAMSGPGTFYYAAPEQLNNKKELIDWRTDQFSLGVLLAICVFGEHPFGNEPEIAIDNVASYKDTTKQFQDKIRESNMIAIEKMVNLWPAKRYRTPKDLLEGWLAQRR